MKRIYLIIILTLATLNLNAQTIDLSGNWQGALGQEDKPWDFAISMTITQSGDQINGTMKATVGDGGAGYAIFKIYGTISTSKITLYDESVIDESSDPRYWYWCKKIYTTELTRQGDSIYISGSWKNNGNEVFFGKRLTQGYTCYPGIIKMSLYSPEKKPVVSPGEKFIPTLQREKDLFVNHDNPNPGKTENLEKPIYHRDVKIRETITLHDANVEIEIYDDKQYDGDTITVYFDGTKILEHIELSFSPIKYQLRIQPGKDQALVIFAENHGKFGVNTSKIVIKSTDIYKEVVMHSSLNTSQSVVFKYSIGNNHDKNSEPEKSVITKSN